MKRTTRLATCMALASLVIAMGVSIPAAHAEENCKDIQTVSDLGDDGGSRQLRASLASVCAGGTVQIVPGSLVLQGGSLVVARDVTIRGLGTAANPTVIDAHHASRVIDITSAHVKLSDVTLTSGTAIGSGPDGSGGAIRSTASVVELDRVVVTDSFASNTGGGVANVATSAGPGVLTVRESSISSNTATVGGGGISNVARGGDASLVIDDSAITSNLVTGPGLPVAPGGGILSTSSIPALGGTVSVSLHGASVVASNRAQTGGGIFSNGVVAARLTLNDESVVSGNTATQQGGGIFSIASSGTALLTLNDESQVAGNTAQGNGGGVFNEGDMVLGDSARIERNVAVDGAGLYNWGFAKAVSVTLQDEASISANTASGYGGGVRQVVQGGPASLTLRDNSSIHDNTANLLNASSGGGVANSGGVVTLLAPAAVFSNHPNNCSGTIACT